MFGKRSRILSALAAVSLLSSGGVVAQIPDAFTGGFEKSTELRATYPVKDVKDGDVLSPADTAQVPKFALGGSSGINPKTKYTILMIDPDSPTRDEPVVPQVLHYLKTDFSVTDATNLNSVTAPALKYVGPDASTGTGPHRYIFLLYVQPEGFVVKGVPGEGNRAGFNVSDWRVVNGLKRAVAGIHFVATPPEGGAGGTAVVSADHKSTTTVAGASTKVGYTLTYTATSGCSTTAVPQETTKQPAPTYTSTSTITTPPTSGLPPASTGTKTHTVKVGGPNILKYNPETVIATPGDTVYFDFLQVNHTVTQSTFDSPCVFLPGGARSGFRPNPQGIPGNQTFTFVVPDEKPKWFYCAQGKHCQSGMVFAINPGTKFPDFLEKAKANATSTASSTGATPPPPPPPTPTAGTTLTGVISNPAGTGTGTGVYTEVKPTGTATVTSPVGAPNGTASGAPVFSGNAVPDRGGLSLAAIAGGLLAALVVV